MNTTAQFLIALGQALASIGHYGPSHPMRATARDRALAALIQALEQRGAMRFSLLDGDVVVGTRVMTELKGWEWAGRLAAAGIQRLEVDAVPLPGAADLDLFLKELSGRLAAPPETPEAVTLRGFRFGPLTVDRGVDQDDTAVDRILSTLSETSLVEEAAAIRWIHDEVAGGHAMPMAEVEAIIHSLALSIRREQHMVLPLLELRQYDEYTVTHSCNVAMLSMGLAEELGLTSENVRAIGTAALLHDIGKVRIPPEVLVKPGRLTDEEMDHMRRHPVEGARILSARGQGNALAATVAYEHHIWENGERGYPMMAFTRRCHYASRLVHVCDVYDALSTRRPYRDAWPREKALSMLAEQAGTEMDPHMVRAFLSLSEKASETRTPLVGPTAEGAWSSDLSRTAAEMREAAESTAAEPSSL